MRLGRSLLSRVMESYETQVGADVALAAHFLKQHELVAIPTETVYGLAGHAGSETAIHRIYAAKARPLSNPLIIHTDNLEKIHALALDLPPLAIRLFETFSPGPLTILLPKRAQVLDVVTAGSPLAAFRIPNHPLLLRLLCLLDFPLVAPSANRFMSISPTTADHVRQQLDGQIPYILDGGACAAGIESTVIGIESPDSIRIYRQGAITEEALQAHCRIVAAPTLAAGGAPHSPGMLAHHYAPKTPLYFVPHFSEILPQVANKSVGLLQFDQILPQYPSNNQYVLSKSGSLEEAARRLYQLLYELDSGHYDLILTVGVPETGLGRAINDRLRRASQPVTKPFKL